MGPFLQILRHTAISLKPMSQGDHIMERYGIKATTSQSPIPTDKGSTVQVEAPNIQTLPDFSNSLRSIERRLHYLLVHGLGAKTLPSPIYFDNVLIFQILHDYWKYHKPTAISKKPMSLRDHNMERNGIKATTSQSPIPSDKGSIVQVEFQAPEMQTIHFRDELCFSNPAIPLTPCTIPFVVKDESTVQNRDQADRRQMVTDAPEVLDTHLTKEDVDSKVPQNNWREGIFSLRWKHLQVHQVIVVFLLMTSSTQGISSHCEIIRTVNCTQLFLTCNFDTDINQLGRNFYMNHVQNNSVDLEVILVCQKNSTGFQCDTSPTYEFVSIESNSVTVKIPEISSEHFGKYWCTEFVDNDREVCQLSLPDTSSEDCFEQDNGPSGKDDRFSPATIAIIVLSISLVLVGTSLIVIYFRSSGSAKYIATRFNFENCKSGRSAPTINTKEECEKL